MKGKVEGGKIDVDGMAACVDSFSGIKDCEPPIELGSALEGRDGHGSSLAGALTC